FIPFEPPQIGRRDAHEEFATELSRLYMAWRIPALDHPDAPALEVLSILLGNGRSSYLNRNIRERKNLVHSIACSIYSTHHESVLYIFALTDPDKRIPAEKEILQTIRELENNLVSDKELEKARRIALSDLLDNLTTAEGRAASHGANWFLTRNLNFGRELLEELNKVTSTDISRVIKQYLREDRLSVASLNPKGSLTPQDREKKTPEPPKVEKNVLSNGLTLLTREDARLPLISVAAVFRGGTLVETPQDNGITQLYSQTFLKGTLHRSADEIADQIESAGGSISSSASNDAYSISIEVLKDQLPLAFEILADILSAPAFPEKEINTERDSQLAAIKAEEDQITAVARNLLRSNLFGSHPYSLRPLGSLESVSHLNRQQLLDFHHKFTVAKNCVLSVFGDIHKDDVLHLAEKFLASLPPGEKAFTNPPLPNPLQTPKTITHQLDKEQAFILIGYLVADILSPDRPALEILSSESRDIGSRFF
ncbi:MAG: insulinase family protein, partial [Chthoniobacterales bacterium]|nr:insulinase family protein [Chthoniobacterales bacterium]